MRSTSRASPAGRSSARFGVRERNLWDVAFPEPDDPTYKQMPTHFRAELHDRLAAPIYPIAFTVLCFAILGAPRTSRQSREMSIIMTIVAGRRAAADRLRLQRDRGANRRRGRMCCGGRLRSPSRPACTRSRAAP